MSSRLLLLKISSRVAGKRLPIQPATKPTSKAGCLYSTNTVSKQLNGYVSSPIKRCFSDATAGMVRETGKAVVSKEKRAALRAARRERAAQVLQQQQQQVQQGGGAAGGTGAGGVGGGGGGGGTQLLASRYIWYAAVGVPSILLVWGFSDENSPPAQFSKMIGLTGFIERYTEDFAKPAHDKLLPDWSQVRQTYVVKGEQPIIMFSFDSPKIIVLIFSPCFYHFLYLYLQQQQQQKKQDAKCTTRYTCTTYSRIGLGKYISQFYVG